MGVGGHKLQLNGPLMDFSGCTDMPIASLMGCDILKCSSKKETAFGRFHAGGRRGTKERSAVRGRQAGI